MRRICVAAGTENIHRMEVRGRAIEHLWCWHEAQSLARKIHKQTAARVTLERTCKDSSCAQREVSHVLHTQNHLIPTSLHAAKSRGFSASSARKVQNMET